VKSDKEFFRFSEPKSELWRGDPGRIRQSEIELDVIVIFIQEAKEGKAIPVTGREGP
jgi:hypothetical protein